MYYEMRTYNVALGKVQAYNKVFEEMGLPIISRYLKLVGWWYTEIGQLNQIVHIWAYESLDDRTAKRAALYQDPDWLNTFIPQAFPMLVSQESKIILPSNFSPIR